MDPSLDPLVRLYLEAQLEGDRLGALDVIVKDVLSTGMAAPEVHLRIIAPAQHEIGRLWEKGALSIAQEHVATTISRFVMGYLVHAFPRRPRNGKKVLLGCVEGELHELAPLMCMDFLEMVGFNVLFFGSRLPIWSLIEMIDHEQPDLVALSVSAAFNLMSLQRTVDMIRNHFGDQLKIAAGGQAVLLAPLTVQKLGVLQPGKDGRDAANTALDLLVGPVDRV